MTYSHSLLAYLVATFFAIVGTLLLIAEETDLVGLVTLAWFAIAFVFFIVAHWIPGPTR